MQAICNSRLMKALICLLLEELLAQKSGSVVVMQAVCPRWTRCPYFQKSGRIIAKLLAGILTSLIIEDARFL